jgi:dTDP-4-dehydrorhamnose 3,5-epimerase
VKFVPLAIEGALGVIGDSHADARGSLTRVWDTNSLLGNFDLVQSSIVLNPEPRTLRGIHFQTPPFSENKVVECVSGKVFDVIVDLRKESSTYRKYLGLNLGPSENYLGIFVPAGCAHGYLTLEENSTLIYFMDREYSPENAQGLCWNDPVLSINWPNKPALISERDLKWPMLSKQ